MGAYTAKPLLCHSSQCYYCLFIHEKDNLPHESRYLGVLIDRCSSVIATHLTSPFQIKLLTNVSSIFSVEEKLGNSKDQDKAKGDRRGNSFQKTGWHAMIDPNICKEIKNWLSECRILHTSAYFSTYWQVVYLCWQPWHLGKSNLISFSWHLLIIRCS